jgi:hypothetical protein
MLIAFATTLSAFSGSVGADSFKVYLNDKLLFEKYVTRDQSVKSISLSESSANDQLIVYYDHCGRIGTGRSLTLLNGSDVLKKWEYNDTQSVDASGMICRISDIKSLRKGGRAMELAYSSKELSTPVRLLTISAEGTEAKVRK